MKQKIALIIIITLISFPTVFASGTELSAVKTTSSILLDNEEKNITAYLVNNNNYFKLRDVAYIWMEQTNNFLWIGTKKTMLYQ